MIAGALIYKGTSSEEFHLVCKSTNHPILPVMFPRTASISGKSGVIDYKGNTYGTRLITQHISYIGSSIADLRAKMRQIAVWLTSTQFEQLIFADEPDKFYLARIYSQIDLEQLGRMGEADITFECQPCAYRLVSTGDGYAWGDADIAWGAASFTWASSYSYTVTGNTTITFNNPGTMPIGSKSASGGKFNIKVVGSLTNITLAMNSKTLTYSHAISAGTLIIDNVNMEVTENGVDKLYYLTGDLDNFLTVNAGDNTLTITGAGLNATVTIDFLPEWI